MKYCIISISEQRSNNIDQITHVMGTSPEDVKFCNMKSSADRSYFRKKFPQFDFTRYAENPLYFTDPGRKFGAIGCWMSHVSSWQYIISNKIKEMIVFEDDCLFNRELFDKTLRIIQENSEKELIMLGQWTEMYYIKLSAAEKLLDNAIEKGYSRCPVDEYMFNMIRESEVDGVCGVNVVKQLIHIYPSDMRFSIFEDNDA